MKAPLICILLAVSFFVQIKNKNTYTLVRSSKKHFFKDSIPSDTCIIDFSTKIQPIFVNHCSPCHFTGGKMYERLPFDKEVTIVTNGEAILRRIRDEKESELIKQYIQQRDK